MKGEQLRYFQSSDALRMTIVGVSQEDGFGCRLDGGPPPFLAPGRLKAVPLKATDREMQT
jgi:hypothetical protein